MSKFIIEIKLESGSSKQVKVYVDNRTAEILNLCDVSIRQAYLEEEYKWQNRDRAETRKHISLETSIENGYDYIAGEDSPMDKLLNLEEKAELKLALDKLTDKQYRTFMLYVVEGLTFEEIGLKLGTSWQGAQFHFNAAQKKLKKFLKNYL